MSKLPLHPRGVAIEALALPGKLQGKLLSDDVIHDTWDLYILHPDALRREWKLTTADFDRLNKGLAQRGMKPMTMPDGAQRAAARTNTCPEPGRIPGTECGMPKMKGKRKCGWHVFAGMPIEKQISLADQRGAANRALPGHVERTRVPQAEWPEGGRWCSECQGYIPWIYVTGTKCKAHASRAAHASMTKRVYDLSREQYEALLRFQSGRCYICGQLPSARRLAVDHDHVSGAVRGLLCSNDEWGCNVSLRRLLNSLSMAQRALEYVTKSPWDRLNEGIEESTPRQDAGDGYNPFEKE